jgi:hypothetical protein
MTDKDENEVKNEAEEAPPKPTIPPRPDEAPAPKGHATKGMTRLGYTEASRIENTTAQQEAERKG